MFWGFGKADQALGLFVCRRTDVWLSLSSLLRSLSSDPKTKSSLGFTFPAARSFIKASGSARASALIWLSL